MDEPLRELARSHIESGLARIPVFPGIAVRAEKVLANPNAGIDEVQELVSRDPALAAALLRAANSAAFGAREEISTIREAIVRLGIRRTAQLVIVFSQHRSYQMHEPRLQEMAERLWKHATASAVACDWLARRVGLAQAEPHAMLAGLLHDVGMLFVLGVLDDVLAKNADSMRFSNVLTLELIDSLHAEQGDRLLESWSVPQVFRDVVRHHHDEKVDPDDGLLLVVRIVDRACHRLGVALGSVSTNEERDDDEALAIGATNVVLAELEIRIEDAARLAT